MESLKSVVNSFRVEYSKTPAKLKVLDCFCVYALATAAIQFAYMLTVGSFPFNAFLSGFFCCLGAFVFTVCLRMQSDPANQEFKHLSTERAFADYCVCCLFLFLVVWNFIG
ncbi:hypothetical protein BSKO_10179 [Bryopsis sp. KO-2023]|nr:hypothetical protein BSKO_10179 [Bryopsis sp. KO-2023]